MFTRSLAIAALAASLVFTGGSAFAASTSTKLSNGTLYFEAQDGSVVNGNSSLFYGATKYTKTGGSAVYITLKMETYNAIFSDSQKQISSGQTISHSFGGISKSFYAPDCAATGLMDATTGTYYTPTVHFC